jgi:hypothetical protein
MVDYIRDQCGVKRLNLIGRSAGGRHTGGCTMCRPEFSSPEGRHSVGKSPPGQFAVRIEYLLHPWRRRLPRPLHKNHKR